VLVRERPSRSRTLRPAEAALLARSPCVESHAAMGDGWKAALLLLASNVFMTAAWYGHLKFRHTALWVVVLASWGIAFFEYCLQVPANRIGVRALSAYQLKIMQEAISLAVFVAFAQLYLGERFHAKYAVSFLLLFAAVAVAFRAP
jgi:hypothetical protein